MPIIYPLPKQYDPKKVDYMSELTPELISILDYPKGHPIPPPIRVKRKTFLSLFGFPEKHIKNKWLSYSGKWVIQNIRN